MSVHRAPVKSQADNPVPPPLAINPPYRISGELQAALESGQGVGALESSLIAHGFPKPDNLALAYEIEAAVRDGGAVPATIALVGGVIHVGLDDNALSVIAGDDEVRKCSTRDLGYLVAQRQHGGTTVAATARIAAAAGVEGFATGGIGGVHRGAGESHDISADLVELGRTQITLVCAGAKVLLDLPATLEFLETQSVAVIGYRCDEFPAFYAASSGLPLNYRVDDAYSLAAVVRAHQQMGGPASIVVCNPPPSEHALPVDKLERMVEDALVDAAEAGVSGAQVTPYVLGELTRRSKGRTRDCNRALILDNAKVAAELAVALSTN